MKKLDFDTSPKFVEEPLTDGHQLWGGFSPEIHKEFARTHIKNLRLMSGNWLDISPVIDKNREIKKLTIQSTNVDWNAISLLTNLESLILTDNIGSEIHYGDLVNLKALYCNGNDKFIDEVYSLEGLEYLHICGWKEVNFTKLGQMKNLKKIQLIDARKLVNLEGLSELLSLIDLQLHGVPNLSSIEELNRSNNIQILGFTNCKRLKLPNDLSGLSGIKYLSFCKVADLASIKWLENCKNIEVLKFIDVKISDGDLTTIPKLKKLKRLILQNRRNYNIDLKGYIIDLKAKFGSVELTEQDWFTLHASYFGYQKPWL